MVQRRTRGRAIKKKAEPSRPAPKILIGVVILIAAAPFIHREMWLWGERSNIGRAVETVRNQGCLTCHPKAAIGYRWRADGEIPENSEVIRDALTRGRPAVPSMPGPMPSIVNRVGAGTMDRILYGTEVTAGLIDFSDEAEVRIGLTIAAEMGCFDCHGPMGAGGVRNPGTVGGMVPGFYGASFDRQAQTTEGIEAVVRDGRPAQRAWWTPWKKPALDMPAYGDRLDSTEIALLVHAIRSLSSDPSAR